MSKLPYLGRLLEVCVEDADDVGKDVVRALVAVDAGDVRQRDPAVLASEHVQPCPDVHVHVALHQPFDQRLVVGRRGQVGDVIDVARDWVDAAPWRAHQHHPVGALDPDGAVDGDAAAERLGLPGGPREPVEDAAALDAVGLTDSVQHVRDDNVVRYEASPRHVALCLAAELGLGGELRPKDVTG